MVGRGEEGWRGGSRDSRRDEIVPAVRALRHLDREPIGRKTKCSRQRYHNGTSYQIVVVFSCSCYFESSQVFCVPTAIPILEIRP